MFGKVLEEMVNVGPTLTTIGFRDLNTAFCSFVVFLTSLKMLLEDSFIVAALPNAKLMHIRQATPTTPDGTAINVGGVRLRIKINKSPRTISCAITIYSCSKNCHASTASMCKI